MPGFHPIFLHPPWFCEEASRLSDEPQCSRGSQAPLLCNTFFLFSCLHPPSAPLPSLPKSILMTPTITGSFRCLAPHLSKPPVPLYHKTTPESSGQAVFTPLPPPPNRSWPGFCHQHSTENMPLKIPSLPNWPGWMGFSPHPPLPTP